MQAGELAGFKIEDFAGDGVLCGGPIVLETAAQVPVLGKDVVQRLTD
jgi:hypothetical protein